MHLHGRMDFTVPLVTELAVIPDMVFWFEVSPGSEVAMHAEVEIQAHLSSRGCGSSNPFED
jgi:hypothetical protein